MSSLNKSEKLGRNISFLAAFAIGTGTMIGAGIFVLPGIAITNAGPAAIFSFLFGGVLALCTALSLSELATGMPKAGGSYYFISRSMGPAFGTIVGLGAWLSLVFKGSFALIGLAEYLKIIFPIPVLITAIVSGIILLMINYRGTEGSGILQNGIVVGLFVILLLFIFKGSFLVEKANFRPFMPNGYSSIFTTTGLIFVSYLGIAKLAAISEEVKDPDKNLPRAFIFSVVTVTLLYIGIMLIVNGVLPLEQLVGNETPLVDVANILAGRWGEIAIIIAGFFATVSTANAAVLSSSRFPFAMARDKLMPESFTVVHKKHKTPYLAILVTGLTMILLLFIFDVEQLANLGSIFNVLIFVLVNIAVIILRNNKKEWYNPGFRDPFYPFSQIIGIVGCLSLVPFLGSLALIFAFAVIVVGYLWYRFYADKNKIELQYNLFDMIENNPIPSLAEKGEKVLISIADPAHQDDLLRLADYLGDSILGLHVIKVPSQTDLETIRRSYSKKNGIQKKLFSRLEKNMEQQKKEKKYIEIFSRNIADTIIEQVESEGVDLLLIGWHRYEKGLQRLVENVSRKVINNVNNNLVVLKGYFPEKIETIIIPYAGGDNSRYALYLAKKLTQNTEAKIKLLRIVNPETDEKEKEEIKRQLEKEVKDADCCQIEYEIRERYSPVDTIIDAGKECDLMIMGDRNKRFPMKTFGDLPQRVIRHVNTPFLLVKRFSPISKRGIKTFLRNIDINGRKKRS